MLVLLTFVGGIALFQAAGYIFQRVSGESFTNPLTLRKLARETAVMIPILFVVTLIWSGSLTTALLAPVIAPLCVLGIHGRYRAFGGLFQRDDEPTDSSAGKS